MRRELPTTNVIAPRGVAALLLVIACRSEAPSARQQPAASASANVTKALAATRTLSRAGRGTAERCAYAAKLGCDVRSVECQEQLFELARCSSGREGARPPLRLITPAASKREQLEHHRRKGPARAALERAVYALGLGQAPGRAEVDPVPVSGGAYYAPRRRAVHLVTHDTTPWASESTALTLVHEYVHALQDARGDLAAVLDGAETRTFDQELVLWSTFEGEATLHEEVARRLAHGLVPHAGLVELFAERTDGTDAAILRQRRPLEASLAMFPYTYGAHWAVAAGSERPASSYELLALRHGWPAAQSVPCASDPGARRQPPHDGLGAWFVQSYVRRITGHAERARSVAQRWRGDSIWVDATATAPSFRWQTCWDSRATALEMRALIEAQLSGTTPAVASVTVDAQRVTATFGAGAVQSRSSAPAP